MRKFFDQMEIFLTNHSMISSFRFFLASLTSGEFSGEMILEMGDRKVMISTSKICQNLGTEIALDLLSFKASYICKVRWTDF